MAKVVEAAKQVPRVSEVKPVTMRPNRTKKGKQKIEIKKVKVLKTSLVQLIRQLMRLLQLQKGHLMKKRRRMMM